MRKSALIALLTLLAVVVGSLFFVTPNPYKATPGFIVPAVRPQPGQSFDVESKVCAGLEVSIARHCSDCGIDYYCIGAVRTSTTTIQY